MSAGVDVDLKSDDDDGVESEEDESVNENGFAVGLHAAELELLAVAREREKQTGLKKDEENHSDYDCPLDKATQNESRRSDPALADRKSTQMTLNTTEYNYLESGQHPVCMHESDAQESVGTARRTRS
ncbi:hypothetical protein PIB30_070324 [Stylosanthes scabra]|uniref:Uncharacterized protein n=1 Tax=Stylosanthes scabra TaxID=79078 RepID=A0ABU6ZM99_9FABA|nr:hypothetical protein [Stylosanthes scabra]